MITWGGRQATAREVRWIMLLICLLYLLANHAFGQTGHVEWTANGGFSHSISASVTGTNHTVYCSADSCAVDAADGFATVVLDDGTKLLGVANQGALLQLAQQARQALLDSKLPTPEESLACVQQRAATLNKAEKKAQARSIVSYCQSSHPVWPTFNYTLSNGTVVVK